MGVAKSDFCQMRRSDLGLIKNMERFARIDLDRSRFEKERNQCFTATVSKQSLMEQSCLRAYIVGLHLIMHRLNGLYRISNPALTLVH